MPYVFTEQGIYMLATVLRGELAEQQSVFIMRAFREMRHYIKQNQQFVTQSEIRLVTAKVSEISVQVAGVVDWKNKAEDFTAFITETSWCRSGLIYRKRSWKKRLFDNSSSK